MKIDLSTVTFNNDIFSVDVDELNSSLVIYRLNEDFKSEEAEESIKVDRLLLALVDSEGNQRKATSVIGLSVGGVSILTDREELKGSILNSENMKYCSVKVGDSE